MLRADSKLFQEKNITFFIPIIRFISRQENIAWEIDVQKYTDENINLLVDIYTNIRKIIKRQINPSIVLITKIMLGVFGSVPAFDQNSCATFRSIRLKSKEGKIIKYRAFNPDSLKGIKAFLSCKSQRNRNDCSENIYLQICYQ